jgi:hypothetical protein
MAVKAQMFWPIAPSPSLLRCTDSEQVPIGQDARGMQGIVFGLIPRTNFRQFCYGLPDGDRGSDLWCWQIYFAKA